MVFCYGNFLTYCEKMFYRSRKKMKSYLLQFWFIKNRDDGQAAGRAGPTIDPTFARPKIEQNYQDLETCRKSQKMYMTRRFSYCLPVTSYLLQFWFIKTRAEGQAAGRAGPTIDPAFARPKIERKLRSSNKVFFGEQWLVKPLILRQYWCEKVSSPHKSLLMYYSTKLYRDNVNLAPRT